MNTNKFYIRELFKTKWRYSIAIFACLGFLLSVTQVLGEGRDYYNYTEFFDLARIEGGNIFSVSRFESGFSFLIILLSGLFTNNIIVYSCLVSISMLLKGWVISVFSSSRKIFLVAALFYFARYFPLHELTQLRAAFAIGLLMVGATFLWSAKPLYGFFCFVLALLFHVSVAVILPALLLPFFRRWQVIIIGGVVFIITTILSDFIVNYLANFIQILNVYQSGELDEVKPNPIAISLLIDWMMIVVSFLVWGKLTLLMKRIVLLEVIGMALFYGGIELAVLAHRLREMYSVFWIFFVIDGLRQKATRSISYVFVFISIIFYIYTYIFSGNFFN